MNQEVTGPFEVKVAPQEPIAVPGGFQSLGRFTLEKTFTGPLAGRAYGTMLSIGAPKAGTAAAYVALDQFSGTLEGRRGGFVLVHRGIMSKQGVPELDVRIATDSGTGELEGIAGSLTIDVRDGKHYYQLNYTLPSLNP